MCIGIGELQTCKISCDLHPIRSVRLIVPARVLNAPLLGKYRRAYMPTPVPAGKCHKISAGVFFEHFSALVDVEAELKDVPLVGDGYKLLPVR